MKTLSGLALLLVLVLVSLSAYLRLAHSGIGCADWPECYGYIGPPPSAQSDSPDPASVGRPETHARWVNESSRSLSWARPLHRLIAAALGMVVVFLVFLSLRQKRHRGLTMALLALTIFLALLGTRSESLHAPAVVIGNLAGGFAMVGLLGWLWYSLSGTAEIRAGVLPAPWFLGLVVAVLALQILLGGLTSANFAATACRTLPDCHGSWWPGPELAIALDLTRILEVTPSGQAIGGGERMAIHQAHRIGALIAGGLLLIAGILSMRVRGPARRTAIALVLLVLTEFSIGVMAVRTGLPIWLAVAHNWLAALLLLVVFRLLSFSSPPRLPPQ